MPVRAHDPVAIRLGAQRNVGSMQYRNEHASVKRWGKQKNVGYDRQAQQRRLTLLPAMLLLYIL
jgi:hypothetical protein